MSGAKEHYAELLGGVYAWSVSVGGDPFERASELRPVLQEDSAGMLLQVFQSAS